MKIYATLWILMAWYFNTMLSVATVLSTYPWFSNNMWLFIYTIIEF